MHGELCEGEDEDEEEEKLSDPEQARLLEEGGSDLANADTGSGTKWTITGTPSGQTEANSSNPDQPKVTPTPQGRGPSSGGGGAASTTRSVIIKITILKFLQSLISNPF